MYTKLQKRVARLLTVATLAVAPWAPASAADEPVADGADLRPLVEKLPNGDYQVGDLDLGPFGVSSLEEFLAPPVQDAGAEVVESFVGDSLRTLENDLPELIRKLNQIEQHPELLEDGLVAVFEDFVRLLNNSLPTHVEVTDAIELTRDGLLDLHDQLVKLAEDLERQRLSGSQISLIEQAWPLAFGSTTCAEQVGAILEANAAGGLATDAAAQMLGLTGEQCASREDMGQLRSRILTQGKAGATDDGGSALVQQNADSGLPVLGGLLDFGQLGNVVGELGDNLLAIVEDLTEGEGINLVHLNGTTQALYDYTGAAGLPFAWLQFGDSMLPFIPGTALPLITSGPRGLELVIVRLEPSLSLAGDNSDGLLQGLASGSLLFKSEIRVILERPMAKHLVEMIQNQELLRGLLESQALQATQALVGTAGGLLGPLESALEPFVDAPLEDVLNAAVEGDVSAVIEWILRRFPSVIALVPGGEIVPVSGEDVASLLGYDIRNEYQDGEGVCEPLTVSATTYVQLDRSESASIYFTRFAGQLPQRIDVTVGTDTSLSVSLANDISVGAALALTPVCTTAPLDGDLKGVLNDLDASLQTDLVGIVEELIPPTEPRAGFDPVVYDPPVDGDSRQGPFSAVPEGPYLELSAGVMTDAFVLEEPDARYARFALQFLVDEAFTLGLQVGIEDGQIYAQAGTTPKLYLALATYTKNILGAFNLPIIDDSDERLLTVLQIFGLGEALRVELGADPAGADGLFGNFELIDAIKEVNIAVPLLAGIRAQWGIFNFPELVGLCLAPGNICPNTGYDAQHQDVMAAFRMELSQEAYPYFAILTKDAGVVLGSFMTKLGAWLGFNFEKPFDRANRFYFGVDTDGYPMGGETAIIRCGDHIDNPEDAGDGVCDTVFGLSVGGWAKGQAVEFIDPFNIETLQALVNEVLEFFVNLGTALFDIFTSLVNDVILEIAQELGQAVQDVFNALGNLVDAIVDAVGDILGGSSISSVVNNFFNEVFADFPVSFDLSFFQNFINIAVDGFNAIIDAFRVDVTAFSPIQLHGSMGCSAERTGIDLNLGLLVPDFENLINTVVEPLAGLPIQLPGILGEAANGVDAFVNAFSGVVVGVLCDGIHETNPTGINLLIGDGLLTDSDRGAGGLLNGIPLVGSGVEGLLAEDGLLGSVASVDELLPPVQGLVDGALGDDGGLLPEPVLATLAALLGDEEQGSPLDPARLVLVVNDLINPNGDGSSGLAPSALLQTTEELLGAEVDLAAVPGLQIVLAAVVDGTGELLQLPLSQLPLVGSLLVPVEDTLQGIPLEQLDELLVLDDTLAPVRDITQQVFELTEQEAVQAVINAAESGLAQFVVLPVSNTLGEVAPLLVPLSPEQLAGTVGELTTPVLDATSTALQLVGPDLIRPLTGQVDDALLLVMESPVVLQLSDLIQHPAIGDGTDLAADALTQILALDLAELLPPDEGGGEGGAEAELGGEVTVILSNGTDSTGSTLQGTLDGLQTTLDETGGGAGAPGGVLGLLLMFVMLRRVGYGLRFGSRCNSRM